MAGRVIWVEALHLRGVKTGNGLSVIELGMRFVGNGQFKAIVATDEAHLHRRPLARNVKGSLSEVRMQSKCGYESHRTFNGGLPMESTAS